MSKPKPKDKKNQANSLLQKQLQQTKKQLLDATFTIRKLQERLQRLTIDNKDLSSKYTNQKSSSDQQISRLKNIIDVKQQQNRELLIKSSSNEIQKKQKQQRIVELQKISKQQIEIKNKEIENIRYNSINDIKTLENKLKEWEVFMNEKEAMDKQREKLREDLQTVKMKRIEQLADKDREKVQATDKLKNDMLQKINQTKVSLLSLRKEQLSTTTRLTVLQNHQLTSQLQYQSKQTQKLLFKNQQLQSKVSALQRDLQIHKQVEQQLAKRSHFSKNIIKKLSERVKQLQQLLESNKTAISQAQQQKINKTLLNSEKSSQIILSLQKNIQQLQKRCQKLESDLSVQKNEVYYLETKLEQYQGKVQRVGCLLVKHLDEILDNKVEDGDYVYSLKKLKEQDVKQWSKQDRQMTVTLLLNLIKPFLTKRNVSFVIPPIKKCGILQDQFSQTPAKILPRLGHSASHAQRKTQIKTRLNQVPLSIATKIVGSSLRQWGKTINHSTSSTINLSRRFRVGNQ